MPQGIYERTKKHREQFARNMHTASANKRRQETLRKNRELAEEEKVEKEIEEKSSIEREDKERIEKSSVDTSDKYDHTANHIKNMTRGKCEDELAVVRYEILSKVQRLSDMWKSLVALQEKRERLEIRLEELGFK